MATRRRTRKPTGGGGRPKSPRSAPPTGGATTGGGRRTRRPAAVPAPPPPPIDAQKEILELARSAGLTIRQALIGLVVLAALAGALAGLWTLRPVPSYASGEISAGSPFDVTFRIHNTSELFPLANLEIYCVLAYVRASSFQPAIVAAANVALPGDGRGLAPGASGSFTCPFRAAVKDLTEDDPGVAQRAEIYFRSRYDLPFLEVFRLTDNSTPFTVNTRLLPPRWTPKPAP
ncbi:MAG: hypothetical protein ACOY4R_09090 [Pseudomonadota bacterium]